MSAPDATTALSGAGVRGRVVAGALRLVAGRGGATAMQLVAFGVIAADLGPARMGPFTLAMALVTTFQGAAELGFQTIVLRDITRHPHRERFLVVDLFYIRLALGVVAYGLVVGITATLDLGTGTLGAVLLFGVVLLFSAIDAFKPLLQVRLMTKAIAVSGLLGAAALLVGTLVLSRAVAPSTWVYLALTAATTLVTLGGTALAALSLRTGLDWGPRPAEWRALSARALPIGVAFLLNYAYFRCGLVVLAHFHSDQDVGQYGLASRGLEALLVFPGLVMSVVMPPITHAYEADRALFRQRYADTLSVVMLVALVPLTLGPFVAWRVLPELPGLGAYTGAGVVASILLPTFGLMVIGLFIQATMVTTNLSRALLVSSLGALAVNVVVGLAIIPSGSYVATAVTSLLTECFVIGFCLTSLARLRGVAPLPRRPRGLATTAVALAGLGALSLLLAPWLQLVAVVLLTGPIVLLCGGLPPAVRQRLTGRRGAARPAT